jgi:hypothetical protein
MLAGHVGLRAVRVPNLTVRVPNLTVQVRNQPGRASTSRCPIRSRAGTAQLPGVRALCPKGRVGLRTVRVQFQTVRAPNLTVSVTST